MYETKMYSHGFQFASTPIRASKWTELRFDNPCRRDRLLSRLTKHNKIKIYAQHIVLTLLCYYIPFKMHWYNRDNRMKFTLIKFIEKKTRTEFLFWVGENGIRMDVENQYMDEYWATHGRHGDKGKLNQIRFF